jgi:hypothetical protein
MEFEELVIKNETSAIKKGRHAVYGGDREREDPAPLKYPLLPVCGAPGLPSVVPLHFLPIVRSAYQRGIVLPPRLSACPNYTCSPGAFQQ